MLEIQVGKAYETRCGAEVMITRIAEGKGSSPLCGTITHQGREMAGEYWTKRGKHRNQQESGDYDIIREKRFGSE